MSTIDLHPGMKLPARFQRRIATGTPSMTKVYTVPPGLFTGFQLRFQAVGFDPIEGWFRTNCDTRQF